LQKIILKDEKPYTDLPNAHIEPIDFEKAFEDFRSLFDQSLTFLDFLSYKFYPKVFEEYYNHNKQYGDVSMVPTPAFFFGMKTTKRF
jgi:pyruvate carboxylase